VAAERHLRGFVPRRGDEEENAPTGGPGRRHEREEKNERHVEAFVQKNRKAAIEEVARLATAHPRAHLVLVGVSATLGAFERELPERIRERVIARLPKPRAWSGAGNGALRDGILEEVRKVIAEREKESEKAAVDAVVGESIRGGLGVIGPGDVVQALNQGRVHRLVLEEDFRRAGWRCDNCDALGANAEAEESCPYCGGELHVVQHLGEALVARTLAEGGEVEVVAHANKLHSYAGVGAFLRQSGGTALRGANPPWSPAPGAEQPT
jgi:peptide subunit release factor 1 (eRF1)